MTSLSLGQQLLEASKVGDIGKIQDLLVRGAPVETCDSHGYGALGLAAWNGHAEACLVLIAHGADLEAKNNQLESPLFMAAWFGHVETSRVLIAHGADLESKDSGGHSPLCWAAKCGGSQVCLLLIARGADAALALNSELAPQFPESTRECLAYPLHTAATRGLTRECIQMLDLGYDIDQKDDRNMTPLQCVKEDSPETHAAMRSWLARQEASRIMEEITGPKP